MHVFVHEHQEDLYHMAVPATNNDPCQTVERISTKYLGKLWHQAM